MATSSHANAVKSLNNTPGRRQRFVFKTFSQRIGDIDIDVYRSLDPLKQEPTEGSSFFRDCLMEWRELNTAEDFISFYEEILPQVQTLPLVLLNRELIISQLLSRLQMKARLSLEPILRLIAALSRDLLEDFTLFLPRIADSLVSLLRSGADREPDIIEQIFMSWSYIMMYMRKYLVGDIVNVLKLTVKLRYYPKEYIQDFMAEAMSFLLRNAPDNQQLFKGIRKVMFEVARKPSPIRSFGASSLLFYVMRGTSSKFHSKADRVLLLLTDSSTFGIADKFNQDSRTLVEVVSATFQRVCEEFESEELYLLFEHLHKKITCTMDNGCLLHQSRLLSLLISTIQISRGCKISDYQGLLNLVDMLVQKYILPSSTPGAEATSGDVVEKILQLMISILDALFSSDNTFAISGCSSKWASVFKLKTPSLLTFIRELLQRDPCIVFNFQANIISAMNGLIETSLDDVVYLLLSFFEKLQPRAKGPGPLYGASEENLTRLRNFLEGALLSWMAMIKDIENGNTSSDEIYSTKLAKIWGIICCYPHVVDKQQKTNLLMDLLEVLDRLVIVDANNIAGVPKITWQSLIGATLNTCHQLCFGENSDVMELTKILDLAKRYKSSSHVLSAVSDFMDFSLRRQAGAGEAAPKLYHPELVTSKFVDAIGIFADNLSHPDKRIRVSTLNILCHYEPISGEISTSDQPVQKKTRSETPSSIDADSQGFDVLKLLFSIETMPLSISTSRKVSLLISRIQMGLSNGWVPEVYIPLTLNGIIGVFHNRFSYIWDQACECLAFLIKRHMSLVWDKFVCYFEQCQLQLQTSHYQKEKLNVNVSDQSSDLVERFETFVAPLSDSTPCSTVLCQMLQSLQKISSDVEARSRQLVPLFLKFLGYETDNVESVGSFDLQACKGRDWKTVLKEWLNLFKLMRNPKSFYKSHFLKDVFQIRLLDESDAEIQMRVLDCLLTWKDDFLLPYGEHLLNLISSKNLREELTTWSVSKESNQIEEGHRAYLIPIVIRLLTPRIRKMKTLASRKHTSIHHRRAILGFIAQLGLDELPLFFAMLMKPLLFILRGTGDTFNWLWTSSGHSMDDFHAVNFLKHFTQENLGALSWKKKYGFLHVIEDILGTFDEQRVQPFLNLLVGSVVRILRSCTSALESTKTCEVSEVAKPHVCHEKDTEAVDSALSSTALKQFKDLRSLCLKIISLVLTKHENHDFGAEFWDLFFAATKTLIEGFKQEGSSSEKPSSLFSCFLAMSRSYRHASLLLRERKLVPDIFSILSAPKASEAIISSVLKFIQNLLDLDIELDEEDSVKKILIPNLDMLISNLHCLFTSERGMGRKFVKSPGDIVTGIFKLLPKYIKGQNLAIKFTDFLLPFVAKKADNHDTCVEVMKILRDVIPISGHESTCKVLTAISPLLAYCELEMRLCICDLFDALAKMDPSVLTVANLVRELNATSEMEMGGLDYDTVINAYEKIGVDFFRTVREDHAVIILSHFVYDMSSDELILRHSAYRALLSFLDFSVLSIGQEINAHHEMTETANTHNGGLWTKPCIVRIVQKFLLKHMGDAMGREGSVRKEWVDLLRELILKLPKVASLGSFKALCSDDAEKDFFSNIVHLQRHRRAKALLRFKNVISTGNIAEGITTKVFIPLFFNMLYDVQDAKAENVRSACVEAIASVCGQMDWKSYYALLNRCFRDMTRYSDKQKVLVRLICSILDHFHFSEPYSGQNDTMDIDSSPRTVSTTAVLPKGSNSIIDDEIQKCLQKSVLTKIQKLLDSDSDKVNVNVSLAALKILKLLPDDIMDSHLSSIIHRVANFLKSRLESIRDEARTALAACLKELGLAYLQFIVKVLRATLKRGYELHVLGYTVNFILSKVLTNPVGGELDHCLNDLLSVIEKDILGDVAEEKEVEKIASKMKETRKGKSFETLKLIAQSVTFKSHALKLLSPVTSFSQRHLSPKVKLKLESMLNHIAAGIERNPSIDQTDLFIFIYGLMKERIDEENSKNENTRDRSDLNRKKTSLGKDKHTNSQCSHLITVFALGLLHNRIKNIKLKRGDEQLLSMLDPFVVALGSCLHSKYEDVVSMSLRCLNPLVRLPLPSLESQADKVKAVLLDIAQSSVNASSPLMESCLRLLTVLLRSTSITLSSDQLHMLIQFPLFVDLERNPSFVALSLLKAIISRKLVVPEIYDIVKHVAELMVTCQEEPIRRKCSQILLLFLLDYRLSGKRLQEHLNLLLKNLSYEHSSGREAVLEMLHTIIMKFPKAVVAEQSQIIFVRLVVCLCNDRDYKVRFMTATAIKLLIGRISPDHILECSLSWYLGENQHIWSAAAQVLGLLAEVMKKGFREHFNTVLPKVKRILQPAASIVSDSQLDLSEEPSISSWKEAYYSLVMLEKMLSQSQNLSVGRDLEDIWEAVCELLLHPHTWLRNIASRLLALYFSNVPAFNKESHEKSLDSFFLMRPSRLYLIAASLCCQLKSQLVDDAASSLITQNLVFTICRLHSLMQIAGLENQSSWSTLGEDEHGRFLKAFQLLDSRKGKVLFASLISDNQNDQGHNEDPCHVLISIILKRMGNIALEMEDIQLKIVLRSYQNISLHLGSDGCMAYAYELLLPLYKVCEGFAGKVISDDVKQIAQNARETMQNILDQNFVQIYGQIRKNLKAKRDKRKKEEKLMAVINPMRNAKRKLRIAEKHRAHKKRKIMTMKKGRWMR